jgi:hypothetical protein
MDEETYTIEKILEKSKDQEGKVIYLVKWQGYDEPTWEPKDNI